MVYVDLVMLLNFGVDLLLILGVNSISGHPPGYRRALLAAGIGGVYGGVCLLPDFRFLGNTLWRMVFLALICVVAFGWNRSAIRRGSLFLLLSMALGGIAIGLYEGGAVALLAAAAGLCLMCVVGFPKNTAGDTYRQVDLSHRGKTRSLMALYDTGNQLRDPVTGCPVLVVGAEVAWELMELTMEQLSSPLETMMKMPGFRLIPYSSVGQHGGLLLAARLDGIQMDGRQWKGLVAFAPNNFGSNGYEALAGGIL